MRQLFQICKFTKLFSNNLEFLNNSRNFLPSLFQYGFSVASVKSSTLDHGDHGLSIESEGWDTFIHVEKMLRATQFGLQKVNHSAVAGKMVLYHSDLKKQDYFCLFFFSKTSIHSKRGWPHPWEVYLHYSGLNINRPFLKSTILKTLHDLGQSTVLPTWD